MEKYERSYLKRSDFEETHGEKYLLNNIKLGKQGITTKFHGNELPPKKLDIQFIRLHLIQTIKRLITKNLFDSDSNFNSKLDSKSY